jgi:hypothetical protein
MSRLLSAAQRKPWRGPPTVAAAITTSAKSAGAGPWGSRAARVQTAALRPRARQVAAGRCRAAGAPSPGTPRR